jgi:RsiW-degrading membrane proteinase PrsW (M82 family)
MPLLTALAVGPGLVLVHVIYALDRHEKEPVRNVLKYVLTGAVAGVLAALLERVVLGMLGRGNVLVFVLAMFVGVGLVEEGSKYLLLRAYADRDAHLNEPFDWVVYAVAVALGFATLENLFYVWRGGAWVGLLRAFTAVPMHALAGTLMGDRLARAALASGRQRKRLQQLAVIEPTVCHGAYDMLVLGAMLTVQSSPTTAGALILAWFGLMLLLWSLCVRRLLQHYRAAPVCLLPPLLYTVPRRLRDRPAPAPRTDA